MHRHEYIAICDRLSVEEIRMLLGMGFRLPGGTRRRHARLALAMQGLLDPGYGRLAELKVAQDHVGRIDRREAA